MYEKCPVRVPEIDILNLDREKNKKARAQRAFLIGRDGAHGKSENKAQGEIERLEGYDAGHEKRGCWGDSAVHYTDGGISSVRHGEGRNRGSQEGSCHIAEVLVRNGGLVSCDSGNRASGKARDVAGGNVLPRVGIADASAGRKRERAGCRGASAGTGRIRSCRRMNAPSILHAATQP
jgi:hypothetical protein